MNLGQHDGGLRRIQCTTAALVQFKISPKFLFSLINYAQITAAQFVNLNLCDWDVHLLLAMRLNPDQQSLTLEGHLLSEIQTAKDTYLT